MVRAVHVRLVFVTTYRQGALDTAMLDRCRQIMADVRDDVGAYLPTSTGDNAHVHHPRRSGLTRYEARAGFRETPRSLGLGTGMGLVLAWLRCVAAGGGRRRCG
ncbi:transposase [Frankia sp. QA3]|nr:transposase [Frankia sp. QA3]